MSWLESHTQWQEGWEAGRNCEEQCGELWGVVEKLRKELPSDGHTESHVSILTSKPSQASQKGTKSIKSILKADSPLKYTMVYLG
jgi:hypothetical protein